MPGGRRADPCEVLRTGPGTQHALTSRRLGHARVHSRTHSADILGSAKHQGHRGNTRDRPPRPRSGETIKQWINKCVSAGQAATGPQGGRSGHCSALLFSARARCVSSRPLSADGPRRPLCQPSVGEREAAVPRTRIGASPLTRTAGGPWPGGSRLPSLTPDSLTGRYPCLVLWPQNSYIKKINRVQFDLLYFVTEGDGVAGIAPCSCAGPFHGC